MFQITRQAWLVSCFSKVVVLCALLLSSSLWANCDLSPAKGGIETVYVAEVYDGDTVLLRGGRKVRLIGINTPETAKPDKAAEPLAVEAYQWLQAWRGKKLYLQVGEDGKDRYGRTLGHLFDTDGNNITAGMLLKGLGFPVTFPPNVAYESCYAAQAHHAASQGVGVWRHPYYRLRDAANRQELKGGFGRFWGKIEKVYVGRKAIWIDLYGEITLRVAKKDRSYLLGSGADSAVLNQILAAVDAGKVRQ